MCQHNLPCSIVYAHCLLPGRAFASLYVLLFLEKEAEIGGCVTYANVYEIQQVPWCTLHKLEISFQYVTNTLQYGGICCHTAKRSHNFVHSYTLDIS